VRVEHLPAEIHHLGEVDNSTIQQHGLLLIVRGLLRAGDAPSWHGAWWTTSFLSHAQCQSHLLSDPVAAAVLSSMFVNVYQATPRDKPDFSWLERAYADISKDYEMWTHDPHLAGQTGLSRYYDFGDGPPPEAVQDESGFYRKVVDYFFFHPAEADDYVVETKTGIPQGVAGKAHSLQVCDVALTMVRPECGPSGRQRIISRPCP
jgi:hypothetical protein